MFIEYIAKYRKILFYSAAKQKKGRGGQNKNLVSTIFWNFWGQFM